MLLSFRFTHHFNHFIIEAYLLKSTLYDMATKILSYRKNAKLHLGTGIETYFDA